MVAAAVNALMLTAWVLGPPGLLQEVTTHLLNSDEVAVLESSDDGDALLTDPKGSVPPVVAVLVKPRSDDWRMARSKGVPIVLVAGREMSDDEVVDAVFRGAEAVVDSNSRPEAVVAAVQAVSAGGSLLSPTQARAIAAAARSGQTRTSISLTPRETDIVESIARGEGIKQTALALGISAKTVENLQSRLFRKLEVRNRAQAIARAHTLGLIRSD
jgi:DNA-binding NarL/FixJ family response regulator